MTYLYTATRIITFFGAVLRSLWEHITCKICKIPVEDTRTFKVDEMCGHVEHEIPEKLPHSFWVCFIPFTLNFLLGCAFSLTGSYRLFYLGDTTTLSTYALVWLGFSCFANCTPCFEDMLSFKDYLYNKGGKASKILLSPFFAVVYVCTYLERYSLTVILSVIFMILFPKMFNLLFPVLDLIDQMVF